MQLDNDMKRALGPLWSNDNELRRPQSEFELQGNAHMYAYLKSEKFREETSQLQRIHTRWLIVYVSRVIDIVYGTTVECEVAKQYLESVEDSDFR